MLTYTCARCGRTLKHPIFFGGAVFGRVCAGGGKKKRGGDRRARRRARHARADERQGELFK